MNNITSLINEDMVCGIANVLSGRFEGFNSSHITPSMIKEYMESLGWESGEFETNGWQYDWWIQFTKNNASYTASGSGYYGKFKFSKSEE